MRILTLQEEIDKVQASIEHCLEWQAANGHEVYTQSGQYRYELNRLTDLKRAQRRKLSAEIYACLKLVGGAA
jgi:hypothetical protein